MKAKAKLISSAKIWVVIYPSITLFLYVFGGDLAALPLYLRTFFLTLTLVPFMVFIGMPFVDMVIHVASLKKKETLINK